MICRPCKSGLAVALVLSHGAAGALLAGETVTNIARSYHVSHWTAEDGFPHNRVNALAQTPDGYLWLGTWRGLARFDGLRFTVFNEVNRPEMVNHTVNALTVDRDGKLLIGTQDGLLVYGDGRFTRFTMNVAGSGSVAIAAFFALTGEN